MSLRISSAQWRSVGSCKPSMWAKVGSYPLVRTIFVARMERKDILLDQIEQVGRAIAKVLADFFGSTAPGLIETRVDFAITQLRTELDIDLTKFFDHGTDALQAHLVLRYFDHIRIEKLADLLVTMVEHTADRSDPRKSKMLNLSMRLYDLAGSISKTFSLERQSKIDRVKKLSDNCR